MRNYRAPHWRLVVLLVVLLAAGIFVSWNVNSQDATPVNPPQTWYVTSNGARVNVRECPSVDCAVIANLADGTAVQVIGISESWNTIQLEGDEKGYIAAFLVGRTKVTPEPTECFQLQPFGGGAQGEIAQTATAVPTVCPTPEGLPTGSPTPSPSSTPSATTYISATLQAVGTAHLNANSGALAQGGGNVWLYEGQAGEIINVYVYAAQPANKVNPDERLQNNLLDTNLIIYAPDGSILAENDDILATIITDSAIEGLVLPEDGTYQLEVRGWSDLYGGDYTLAIYSSRNHDGTPPPTGTAATSTPCVASAPNGWVIYTIRAGDSLSYLASVTGTTIDDIISTNCLSPGKFIVAGQRLFLARRPPTPTYTVTPSLLPPVNSPIQPTSWPTARSTVCPTATFPSGPPASPSPGKKC